MTKEEIRCLTLGKLRLKSDHRVVDIGAGSGAIAVECGLLLAGGLVYAVERDAAALELIAANVRRFGLSNVHLVRGEAPAALEGMGTVDRVIVGGSGGRLAAILEKVREMLVPGGVVVLNCLLLETLSAGLRLLPALGFTGVSYILVNIARSRPLGGGTALHPLNPVYIVSAQSGKELLPL